jgi:hypothetical protein
MTAFMMDDERGEANSASAPNREDGPPLGMGRFEWLLLLLLAVLLVGQLLVPPIVGLADNGDYVRITAPLGLKAPADNWEDRYFLYVNQKYVVVPRTAPYFFSSQLLLGETALAADRLVTRDASFDLRFLAGLHLLLYLLGLSLVLSATRTFARPVRAALGCGLVVAASDVAYIATMNSFYMETASLLFLTVFLGLALRDARARRPSWPRTLLTFVAAALFVSAKPQYYLLAFPLAAWPVALLRGRARLRRWGAVIILSAGLCLWSAFLILRTPSSSHTPVLWDSLFHTILPHSPTPEADLREFGLEPELVKYSGTTAWDSGVPLYQTTAHYGYGDLARFYWRHPGRFLSLNALCARQAFTWREPLLGNFTREAGRPPRSLRGSLLGWSELERRFLPKSLWFLGASFALLLTGCAREWRKHGISSPAGRTALLVAGTASMAALQFGICVAVEGLKDLIKHLYLFQVLYDVCFLSALAYAAGHAGTVLRAWWRSISVEGETEPPTTPGTD